MTTDIELLNTIELPLDSSMESFTNQSSSTAIISESIITGTNRWKGYELRNPNFLLGRDNTLCNTSNIQQNNEAFRLFCYTDKSQCKYRIYFSDYTAIESEVYQNKLCRCLDKLNGNQQLTIYLGNGIYEAQNSVYLGSIIDAICHCKADVTTVINGRAGAVETYLWLYGKKRIVSPYGTLCFRGALGITETFRYWGDYFSNIYTRAKHLGLLSDNDVTTLMTTDDVIYISYAEYLAKTSNT